jgi:hypothetical protein
MRMRCPRNGVNFTLASAIALVTGTVLTLMVGRNDSILIVLLAATVGVIAIALVAFSDSLPVSTDGWAIDILIVAYGLTVVCIGIHWFLVRRDRAK